MADAVSYFIGAFGLALAIVGLVYGPEIRELAGVITRRKIVVTPNRLVTTTQALGEDIASGSNPWIPDLIIGIDGGECIVEAMLAQLLKKPAFELKGDRTQGSLTPFFSAESEYTMWVAHVARDRRLLVVDDHTHTGGTILGARALLERFTAPDNSRVAVISCTDTTIGAAELFNPLSPRTTVCGTIDIGALELSNSHGPCGYRPGAISVTEDTTSCAAS